MTIDGWLFDVYPHRDGMVVWMLDAEGRHYRLLHRYTPAMYVAGPRGAIERASRAVAALGVPVTLRPARQRELMTGEEIPVVRVAVGSPAAYPAAARRLAHIERLTLYNCDVPVGRLFFYETGLYPLAYCRVEHTAGAVRALHLLGSPEDLEYALPPLTTLRLRLVPSFHGDASVSPAHGRRGVIEIGVDGEVVVADGDDPAECLRSLNRMLARYDPDVILTEWGDAFLLPQLRALAARVGLPLRLNRDAGAAVRTRQARSYVTYGQVVYQAGAQMLRGRWHIDLRNSFIYSESEMAGLLEVARLARIPVQDLARTSTGTAISSMQLDRAVRDGVLIPWRKSEPEGFKTAAQLIVTDKGGLTYQPIVGAYESVGELDFSSMYPSLMVYFNISPETIGCSCCPDSRIPEINYTVCRKRKGLVPFVLEHLLARRTYYKRRKRETVGEEQALYDQRQTALKWCLVTCLDGDTVVPVEIAGQLHVAPIKEIIDPISPDGPGVLPVRDLSVFGYDKRFRPVRNRVKNVIKAPAPPQLVRVQLQTGRALQMIPDHRCFVLEDGQLTTKRAAELKEGDLIPVASRLSLGNRPARVINIIAELLQRLPDEEKPTWRVFGDILRGRIAERYARVHSEGKKTYTNKTIWKWRKHGYIPLQFLSLLNLRERDFLKLSIGRGRRRGGRVQQIPGWLKVDADLGFFLGSFIGDGSGQKGYVTFWINSNELDVAQKIRRIMAEKFNLRAGLRKVQDDNMYVLVIGSVALSRILEVVLDVPGSKRKGKLNIPRLIWDAEDHVVFGFLSGLIASDGCVGKWQTFLRISSASKSFVEKIGVLLTSRGIPHDYRSYRQPMYALEIIGDGVRLIQSYGWLSRKHNHTRKTRLARASSLRPYSKRVEVYGPFRCLRIRSIARVLSNSPFVYCFEVERNLRGFVVGGGIFTGNSFGYLGYRNARFGRIEAHESVTAYSREKLLQAKEIAEARGYRMLHALVDSMWLQRPGATREDYETLAREVTAVTALPISVEGVYRWLTFLPSKTHRSVGVPNRYLGVFDDGSTKVRGIEVRRSDVPGIVERTQQAMLQRMFRCRTLAEIRAALPEILGVLEEALVRLRAGEVLPEELVITTHLSQDVADYRHDTVQAVTARSLDRHGARLHPGEAIQYIITDRRAHLPDDRVRPYALLGSDWHYDAEAYAGMLLRAGETLLELFGWTRDRLDETLWRRIAQAGH